MYVGEVPGAHLTPIDVRLHCEVVGRVPPERLELVLRDEVRPGRHCPVLRLERAHLEPELRLLDIARTPIVEDAIADDAILALGFAQIRAVSPNQRSDFELEVEGLRAGSGVNALAGSRKVV